MGGGEPKGYNYWSYVVKYRGSRKSLGYSRWKGPPSGFVFPDGTFLADELNAVSTSLTSRLVEDIYEGQTDPLTMPVLVVREAPSIAFVRRDLDLSPEAHIAKIRQLVDLSRNLEDMIRR